MNTIDSILEELKSLGSASTKKTFLRHGAREPFFGVKIGDLKVIEKRIKKDYALSLALYETGNSDAMYLAGLIADEKAMTESDLEHWLEGAYWYMLSEYTVAWVAAESAHGHKLATKWITDKRERFAAAGWATLAGLLAMGKFDAFKNGELEALLELVLKTLQSAPNRARYTMNSFVIALGTYVPDLRNKAIGIANGLGEVKVDVGDTACQVPVAADYIVKASERWNGKYRKQVRC